MRRLTKTSARKSEAGLDLVAQGMACHCIAMLQRIGILDVLAVKGSIGDTDILRFANPLAIRSAITTLTQSGVMSAVNGTYSLTDLGKDILQHTGLISMLFDGYAGLYTHQSQLALNEAGEMPNLPDGRAIARAASLLSREFIEPLVVPMVQSLGVRGSVCDLGCGHGQMLGEICSAAGTSGIGFEICSEVVEAARSRFAGQPVEIEQGDVTNLNGVWEDVSVLIQCHVFHDLIAKPKCTDLLSSFRTTFPNHRYFFYIDTVAATPGDSASALPGFDYVHGLLGVKPASYEETTSMFRKSGYMIERETPIKGLPNTILWVLRKMP